MVREILANEEAQRTKLSAAQAGDRIYSVPRSGITQSNRWTLSAAQTVDRRTVRWAQRIAPAPGPQWWFHAVKPCFLSAAWNREQGTELGRYGPCGLSPACAAERYVALNLSEILEGEQDRPAVGGTVRTSWARNSKFEFRTPSPLKSAAQSAPIQWRVPRPVGDWKPASCRRHFVDGR